VGITSRGVVVQCCLFVSSSLLESNPCLKRKFSSKEKNENFSLLHTIFHSLLTLCKIKPDGAEGKGELFSSKEQGSWPQKFYMQN
jgi:hypothetical protein